jgi:hypothetical protein
MRSGSACDSARRTLARSAANVATTLGSPNSGSSSNQGLTAASSATTPTAWTIEARLQEMGLNGLARYSRSSRSSSTRSR